MARVYDRRCRQLWIDKIQQHTYRGCSPHDEIRVRYTRASFRQEVKWMLDIVCSFRHSLRWIWTAYTTFPTRCHRKKVLIVCQKGMNEFQTLSIGFKGVEIINLHYMVFCCVNELGFNSVNWFSNLVPELACNIQLWASLQHTSFKISFVQAANAMDQMSICCMAVFQYVSMICQCGASANAFTARRVHCITYHLQVACTHK